MCKAICYSYVILITFDRVTRIIRNILLEKKFKYFLNDFNRWADKSYSVIMFDNGKGGVNSDHTPIDAMVNVVTSHFIDLGKWFFNYGYFGTFLYNNLITCYFKSGKK